LNRVSPAQKRRKNRVLGVKNLAPREDTKGGRRVAASVVIGFGQEHTARGSEFELASWRRAHEELVRLATARAGLDFEEGRWLLCAFRARVHARLGYGSFQEYTQRLFGYGPRTTQEKLRVGEALERLPETARELEVGNVSFSAVRELTRVATADTEHEWLSAARSRTVREIEQLVSGHRPGSRPTDEPESGAVRHVIRLEVSGEALATFREAMSKVRRDAGTLLDDDAAVLLLARQVLEGPRDDGRSNYQVAVTTCDGCRRATQQGRGELVVVGPEIVEMADCDGQHIGRADAHVGTEGKTAPRATQTIPPALRRSVLRRDGRTCRAPGCRHATFVDVHHVVPRADAGRNVAENLVTLCSAHHRAVHRGQLVLELMGPGGFRFLHADRTEYGCTPSPALMENRSRAGQALRLMGFHETDVVRALARVPPDRDANVEQVIREALRELA
jgi:hypothetical protein